jgi:hypothetical protein
MNLKNSEKVQAAEKVAEYARQTGFPKAYLLFEVPADDSFFETLEALCNEYEANEDVSINIHLILDEDFDIVVTDEGAAAYL